jgi:uncharacterized C2H2 Zn-finger protein
MVTIGDQLKLRRDDIKAWPEETIKLILEMQKDGWQAYRSNNHHVVLMAPDGETTLGASTNKNSAKYLAEKLRAYNKANGKEKKVVTPAEVKSKVSQKWPCARPDCIKVFATEGKLNRHIAVDHEGKFGCPDCDEVFSTPQGLGRHRTKHGYVSPKYEQRQKQAENRKKKSAKEDAVKVEEPKETEQVPASVVDETSKSTGRGESETVHMAFDTDGVTVQTPLGQFAFPAVVTEEIVPSVEHVSFIDDRDSWTIDLVEEIQAQKIRHLKRTLNSVGLEMEIRVWRKK